jgi:cation:H+ antiporter
MFLTWIILILGFVFLIKGADFLVDGASSVAKKFGVSSLVIGLTIVAFGTSMPELIVNIFASLDGNTELAIGNILGSNIANILLILGVSAMIYPLSVGHGTVWKEIPFSLLAILVLAFMVNDTLIDGASLSVLTRIDGLILLSFFVIFLYYIFEISKNNKETNTEEENIKEYSTLYSILMIILGLIGLVLGGKWIVDSAVAISQSFGLSQSLIGLTVVAIGTSLPELVTSAVAAYKKNTDIAIGNIVGSNIFNVFWILGLSSVINPLPFNSMANRDVFVTILATVLLFLFLFVGKRNLFERWQGLLFVILYILYIIFIVVQEIS